MSTGELISVLNDEGERLRYIRNVDTLSRSRKDAEEERLER
jgi:hypothetical protein